MSPIVQNARDAALMPPGRQNVPRRVSVPRLVGATILLALMLIGLLVLLRQPWQQRRQVLSAEVPDSGYVVELWEEPYWHFGFGYEFETWLVARPPGGGERWHVIDPQYITFRHVVVLLSADPCKVRVETSGRTDATHMIAEYDVCTEEFRAESEPTVRGTEGWTVLAEEYVR